LILRRLGLVELVVFYASDYSPIRFSNPLFNKLYHLAEAYCAIASDYTWNVTSAIIAARAKKLDRLGWSASPATQLVVRVPIGDSRIRPIHEVRRHSLIYSGTLGEVIGLDRAIDALNQASRVIPDIKLLISGLGPARQTLEAQVKRLGLGANVTFGDYLPSRAEFLDLLSQFAVGLNIYKPSKTTYASYADIGKLKVYAACGLPIVLTAESSNSDEIEKAGAGILVSYETSEIYDAIMKLMLDDEFYMRCRENSLKFAQKFSPDRVFSEAFAPMERR
jgi:glycosyltransferase involved in cell wall biosynthesis